MTVENKTVNGTKRLVIRNETNSLGQFSHQLFGVWDIKLQAMVFLPHPNRKRAEDYLNQLEMDI